MNRQRKLFQLPKFETSSGGTPSHLKSARAFMSRRPMHLVMRSTHAKGKRSFLAHDKEVTRIVRYCTKRFHVKVLSWVNMGNHLHLKIHAKSRDSLKDFLRTLPALIARAVTGAKRGKAFCNDKGVKQRFWQGLCFTRILKDFFEERVLARYFDGNVIESQFGKETRETFFAMTPFPIPRRLKPA